MFLLSELDLYRYPIKVVNALIKDKRLIEVEGRITPYNRCTYKNGKELKQYGYNMSFIVNLNAFIPTTGGLSFWFEEDSEYIWIHKHIVENEPILIKKENLTEIVEVIVSIVTEKQDKKQSNVELQQAAL